MQFATVTKTGIAKAMASALVLEVLASSTGLIKASFGPSRMVVTVDVYNGDPGNNQKVSGANLTMIADDTSNPDNGVFATTDANGRFVFNVFSGSYTVRIQHPDYN